MTFVVRIGGMEMVKCLNPIPDHEEMKLILQKYGRE
jgi:hypothetical protein